LGLVFVFDEVDLVHGDLRVVGASSEARDFARVGLIEIG
jgi:hypothetical protein